MSASSPTPAEQHLGDRLAALVDGELKHDVRDRVLAHLVTCPKCKAEADAQRRLKDVFASAAPPSPSEGLLARLQGLPAGPGDGGPGPGPFDGGRPVDSIFAPTFPGGTASVGRPGDRRPEPFGYVPGGHSVLPARSGGFRIHEVGRAEAERSPWRGRRFAFAAASAVSFAAIALGGALPPDASVSSANAGGPGSGATPLRTAASTGSTGPSSGAPSTTPAARSADYERRRQSAQAPARSDQRVIGRSASGPLTPGEPVNQSFAGPFLLESAFAPPPLIRPAGLGLQLLTAPGPTPSVTPAPSGLLPSAQPGPSPAARR